MKQFFNSRIPRLILAAFLCICLQTAVAVSIRQAVLSITDLTHAEQRYLVDQISLYLLPAQSLIVLLAVYLGFSISSAGSSSLRWLEAVQSLSADQEQLVRVLLEEKRQSAERRETSENLAHQLRNTVGAGLLLLDRHTEDRERIVRILEKISQQTEQYLDTSTRQAVSSGFRYKQTDLNLLIRKASARFGTRRIAVSNPKEERVLHGDPFWLEEMISTLLENALDFSRDAVQVRTSRKDRFYELEVSHSGTIEQDISGRYQTRRPGHYGIGLALADTVARRHQGTFSIGEKDNRVVMVVRLPYSPLET